MNYDKLVRTSIVNLRENLSNFTLDTFVVKVLETLMEIEREEYLNLCKNPLEKGNGHYSRCFKSLRKNAMTINIPRTRESEFKPTTLELLKKNKEDIDDFCLQLTKRGMTTRDISSLLEEFFQEKKSHSSINEMAKKFNEIRLAWEKSKLEKHYTVMFCDATYMTVRRGDSYTKEAVYIAYGVREDGKREILALEINPTESSENWGEIFERIKERGVEKIDLIVADGIKSLENKVEYAFKTTKFQKCVVHKERQIINKTRPKDKAEISSDLRNVFDNFYESSTKEMALKKLNSFITKWKEKYPNLKNYFNEGIVDYYFTYIDFPPFVRKMIYTTNSIENLNRIIKKATKNKLSFESPSTLLDYVFMVIKDFEDSNWMRYPIYDFIKLNLNITPTQTQ